MAAKLIHQGYITFCHPYIRFMTTFIFYQIVTYKKIADRQLEFTKHFLHFNLKQSSVPKLSSLYPCSQCERVLKRFYIQ